MLYFLYLSAGSPAGLLVITIEDACFCKTVCLADWRLDEGLLETWEAVRHSALLPRRHSASAMPEPRYFWKSLTVTMALLPELATWRCI